MKIKIDIKSIFGDVLFSFEKEIKELEELVEYQNKIIEKLQKK